MRRLTGTMVGAAGALAVAAILAAAEAKTFRTALRADPAMIDPITNSEIVAGDILKNVYESFVAVSAEGKVSPALATSWETIDNGSGFRFHLRKGVKFHSGREFTAKDVKFTFETMLTPSMKGGSAVVYLNNVKGAKEMLDGKAKDAPGIVVVDDYTIDVHLGAKDVLFPIYPFMIMDSAVMAEQGPEWFNKVSAGTGPFKSINWKRGVSVSMEAHKDYWGGAPTIDGVSMPIVPSSDTALSMYDAGDIDFLYVPENIVSRVLADARYKAERIESPRAQARYLGMNQTLYAPFKDKRVREAISLSIDREAMIKGLYKGAAFPLNGQITPGVAGFDPKNVPPLKYDPERAKKLLVEAGLPGGKGMSPVDIQSTEIFKDEITYYANQLKRVLGMEVNVKIVERGTHIKQMNAGDVAFFPWGWTADYPDGLYYLSQMWYGPSPYNRARYKNPDYDKLIEKAQATADDTERYKIYHEAERVLMADWATAPLPIPAVVALRKPNVKNVTVTPFGYSPFNKIQIN